MAVERFLCTDLFLSKRNPMVGAMLATYPILCMKKGINNAVGEERFIFDPFVVRIKELLPVIQPCSRYAKTNREIHTAFNEIFCCHPRTLDLFNVILRWRQRYKDPVVILKISAKITEICQMLTFFVIVLSQPVDDILSITI